jgi:hypothetical protein
MISQFCFYVIIALITLVNVAMMLASIIGAGMAMKCYTELVKERSQQTRAELSAALNKGIKEGMSGAIPARTKVE